MNDTEWAVVVSAIAAVAAIASLIFAAKSAGAAKVSAAAAEDSAESGAKLANVEHARWHRERRPVFEATWEATETDRMNKTVSAGRITLHYRGPDDGVDEVRAWLPQGDWSDDGDSQYRDLERPISAGHPWIMPLCSMSAGETFILVDAGPAGDSWVDMRVDLVVPTFFIY